MVGGRGPGAAAGPVRLRLDAEPHRRCAGEHAVTARLWAPLSRRVLMLATLTLAAADNPAIAAELVFDLKLAGGRLPEDMQLIRVAQGNAVTLRWITDR